MDRTRPAEAATPGDGESNSPLESLLQAESGTGSRSIDLGAPRPNLNGPNSRPPTNPLPQNYLGRVETAPSEPSSKGRGRKIDPFAKIYATARSLLQIVLGVRLDRRRRRTVPHPAARIRSTAASTPGADATMTTTTTTSKRAEANRRNARKSTGPKSPEGKDRSKFNALKHGLNARTVVLPGEDAGAFQDRLDAWASDLRPRNDVEQVLVERSATLSWQLERADRADAARLASILVAAPAEEALRQADQAAALGQRLFQDPRGPLPLYPHHLYSFHRNPRVSASGLGDDPDDPARLLLQLESTAAGCRWLLDRWGELGSLLDRGLSWQSPDKLKAIRLLGRQPLDAADSEVVALIFQACHVLDPQTRHASGVERTEEQTLSEAIRVLDVVRKAGFSPSRDAVEQQEGDPLAGDLEDDEDFDDPAEPGAALDPEDFGDLIDLDAPEDEDEDDDIQARIDWQQCGAAFTELRGELTEDEAREYRRRLQGRRVDELRPRDPADARAKLRGIVDQAVARLEAKREVHDQWASVAEANQVDRLSFDASPEGERLRRFQLAGNRSLLRTLETLRKFRRDGDGPEPDPAETDGSPSPAGSEHPGEPSRPSQGDDLAGAASRSTCASDPAETVGRSSPVESPESPCSNSTETKPRPLGPTLNPARSQEGGSPGEPSILSGIEPRRLAEEPVGNHVSISPVVPPSDRRGSPDPADGPTEGLPVAPEGLIGPPLDAVSDPADGPTRGLPVAPRASSARPPSDRRVSRPRRRPDRRSPGRPRGPHRPAPGHRGGRPRRETFGQAPRAGSGDPRRT